MFQINKKLVHKTIYLSLILQIKIVIFNLIIFIISQKGNKNNFISNNKNLLKEENITH